MLHSKLTATAKRADFRAKLASGDLVRMPGAFNPLSGIISLYRAAFFPEQLNWFDVAISAAMAVALFGIGMLVFRRTIRAVLKEI